MSELPIEVVEKKTNVPASVHPTVACIPDADALSYKRVKEWIKSNREKLVVERKNERLGMKGAEARVKSIVTYIGVMQTYLETGSWNGMFFGENEEQPVQYAVLKRSHMAYYPDGSAKRSINTWYPDIGTVWTQEMADAESKFG